MEYIIPTVVGVLALGLGILLGVLMRKKIAESKIGSAEEEASRIRLDAKRDAETLRKEAIVSANEEALRIKNDAEKECKERRNEVQRQERRIQQKEDNLDRKSDNLDKKDELLNKKIKENELKGEKLDALRAEQEELLQKISQMSVEEARDSLLKRVEDDARHDMAVKLNELEAEYKETADEKARNIVSLAIQRCAADSVAEATVSVVDLPSDEMKGRIIGREGRNIRAIETLTGVDLIIDDTPEAAFAQSGANCTGTPSFSDTASTIWLKEYFAFTLPFGLPMCDMMMRAPPSANTFFNVGRAPRIRVSSVILPSSFKGTLKSTRTIAFLPANLKLSIVIA